MKGQKISRLIWIPLAVLLGTAAIPLQAGMSVRASKDTPKAKRVAHARELLGRHYAKSVVRKGEKADSVRKFVENRIRQSLAPRWRKKASKVSAAILRASREHKLDPIFLLAVIQSESSFRPEVSGSVGEIGLMQLRAGTAKWIAGMYGIPWKGERTLKDPVMNVRIGAAYFDFLRNKFDRHGRLYLAAYNMGPTKTKSVLSRGVWPKDYPGRVMKNYVAIYTALARKYVPTSKALRTVFLVDNRGIRTPSPAGDLNGEPGFYSALPEIEQLILTESQLEQEVPDAASFEVAAFARLAETSLDDALVVEPDALMLASPDVQLEASVRGRGPAID